MLSLMFSGQNIPIGGMHTHAGHKIQVQKNLIMGQELTIFYALDHACMKSRTRKTTASSLAM